MPAVEITPAEAARFLLSRDDFCFLTHAFPDGDTLGGAGALCAVTRSLGKRANVYCPDPVPAKFAGLVPPEMPSRAECLVAVDLADLKLAGEVGARAAGHVALCVDHHISNSRYSERLCCDPGASAACEVIFDIIKCLGVEPDAFTVNALYTGIATDTGCFRYSNTTAKTHRVAADLADLGADVAGINRAMFETKSRGRLELEKAALETMEYFFGGRCAVLSLPLALLNKTGCDAGEIEGITALPRVPEGVLAGVTIREKPPGGVYKVSVRTNAPLSAPEICAEFGGGGHLRAAGCEMRGSLAEVKEALIGAVGRRLGDAL